MDGEGHGGVVLRWRSPHAAVPFTIHLYAPLGPACVIDGTPAATGLVYLAPGRHVASFVLEDVNREAGLLMFVASHQPGDYQPVLPSDVAESPVKVVTAGDGTWRYSLDPPGSEDWKSLAFDDGGWPALVAVPTPQPGNREAGAWQVRRCAEAGAACLGLPAPGGGNGTVWVRKVFEVPAPEYRRHPE
jgi:hypothetical protein